MKEVPSEGQSAAVTAAFMRQGSRGSAREQQGFRILGRDKVSQDGFKRIETNSVSPGGKDTASKDPERIVVAEGVSAASKTKDASTSVSSELDTPAIYDLREKDARGRLSLSILGSGGKGIILVHPFFPIWDGGGELDESVDEAQYLTYVERLKEISGNASRPPLVIFEHEPELGKIAETVQALGIESGDIFLVPTRESDSVPLQSSLEEFVKQLQDLGLHEATINGSYFNHQELEDGGCANHVLTVLLRGGVVATAGDAVF